MPVQNGRTIICKWGDGKEYPFEVDQHLVHSVSEEGRTRLKDVYLGTFRGSSCPEGVEPMVQYCLKIINTDPTSLVHKRDLAVPSTREQYDLWEFKGAHFREYLACNNETGTVREELQRSPHCTPLHHCCVVEPVYTVLASSDANTGRYSAMLFERMTIWERLEYLRQGIKAVLELQSEENKVAGLRVLAHRDMKVDNLPVKRGEKDFRVILLDMASILFADEQERLWAKNDVESVAMGAGPHGTCNGVLCSPCNTPPEQVFKGWPQSELVDVFALGGILASLFGSCVHDGKYGNRNPIWEFHDVYGWPRDEGGNNENASGSAGGKHIAARKLGVFRRRYEENMERDREAPGDGPGWLEQALEAHGVRFVWGKEPDGVYGIPEHVLSRVRGLFRRCTRIAPEKRIGLRELYREITDLMKIIPERRNYLNDKLYLAEEAVHLYDLAGADQGRVGYGIYTRQAAAMGRTAIRCATFNGAGGSSRHGIDECGKVFRSQEKLEDYAAGLDPTRQSDDLNVTHCLISLYRYYAKFRSDARFNGEIRIFTDGSCVDTIWDDYGPVSAAEVLTDLETLLDVNVKVRVYCPEGCPMPPMPDERFHWQRTTPFGVAADGSAATGGKRQQPRTAERPGPKRQDEPKIEDSYVCGEEGLYFLYRGRRVYVSKRGR